MQHGDNFHQRCSPVNDHVLLHAEEQDISASEVGTIMAFARNIGQALEGIHQLALNPVGRLLGPLLRAERQMCRRSSSASGATM
jgi:hypothetical protein